MAKKIKVVLRRTRTVTETAEYEDEISDDAAARLSSHETSPVVWAEYSLADRLPPDTWKRFSNRTETEAKSITIDGLDITSPPPKPAEPIRLTKRQAEYLWSRREGVELRRRGGGSSFMRMVDRLADLGLVSQGRSWWRTLTPNGAAELALYEQTHREPLAPEHYPARKGMTA